MKAQERKRVVRNFLLMGVFLLMTILTQGANAPVVTLGSPCNAIVGQKITVPVKVTNFSGIGSLTLSLDYDYSKLHFDKAASTSNPLLGGNCSIGEYEVGNGMRRVKISWFISGTTGVTLLDGTAIASYVFSYISGPVDLKWFEMGPSCEFTDGNAIVLNDTPTSSYYINGFVSSSCSTAPTITAGGPTSFCQGENVILTASAGSAWKWSTNETTQSITVTSSGSYTVEVTDANGAKATSEATVVAVTPSPLAPTASLTQPNCLVATGTITVTSTLTDLTFSIDGSDYTNTTGIFTGLVAGDYFVTAKNAAGCVSAQSSKLTISAQPETPAAPTAELTQPTCTVATGMITVSSDKTGLTFSIDGTTYTNTTGIFSGLTPGDYYVTAKNETGCISAQSAKLTIAAQPESPLAPTATLIQPTCSVATGTITVSSSLTGLTFSIDGTTYTNTNGIFSGLIPGDYYVTAKNETGCVSAQSAKLTIATQPESPLAPTATLIQPTCSVATGTITVSSSLTGLTFSIDGTTYTNTTGIFSGLTPGDYYVTAKNETGCVSAQSAKLTIAAQPESPLAPTATLIQPTCSVATGTITVSSSLTGLTFSIDGTTYTNTTGIFSGLTPGDYYVTAKNEAGCISAQSAKLTIAAQPESPTVIAPSVTPPLVVGSGQVVFSASASAGTIKWFDSATEGQEVFVLNPTISSTTTYYAEAISPAGCVSASRTAVTATAIPQGDEELSYRFANPRIHKVGGFDHFEFDVQVKASEAGTSYWAGNINLDFSASTLSADVANWVVTPGLSFAGKYTTELTVNGSVLNLDIKTPANATDFTSITTAYQTVATLSGKITSSTGVTGIDFNEVNMNGKQFYRLATDPGYAAYKNQNAYDVADFVDTYVGRVYALKYGWTQIVGLNWNTAVNTSVWEGDALVPIANASNLRIHKPATLTLPSDAELTVSGNTDIKPVNGLIIESDAAGTGSLITGTATGTASVQRYMTTDAWHIVSSPVSGQSISGFLSANPTIAVSQDDSFRGMMDYNPDLNEWNAYFTNATGGNLATGKGYSLRTSANSAVSFSGNIHAGNLSSTSLISEKWNCIGNPYTSALEINGSSSSFLTENVSHFDPSYGAIYVWDQPDESNGQYGKYTVISNASPAFEVQQGQAYLVKMKTGSTSVDFNPGMQIHNSALALKSTKSVWPVIKLQASVNSQKSSTIITFGNGMTKGLDPTFDAGLLKGGSDLIVYTKLAEDNGIPFAIQALPMNDLSSMVIPVGLDFRTGGEVVFSAEQMSLPSDCKVVLEDKELKTFTNLSMTNYKTTVAAKSVLTDRFVLYVSSLTTGLDVNDRNDELSAYAVRNVEMRVVGEVSNRAVASVYDIQGRLVVTERLIAGSMNAVKLPSVKTGIYLLFVTDGDNLQRFKVPVSE